MTYIREKQVAANRRWRLKNPKKQAEYMRSYRRRQKERRAEQTKKETV